MKKSDIELIQKLRKNIDRYLQDQQSTMPLHKVKDIPSGIRGYLADLVYIDKVDNDALVNFISILLYAQQNRADTEVMTLITDIRDALYGFNFEADDTDRAH